MAPTIVPGPPGPDGRAKRTRVNVRCKDEHFMLDDLPPELFVNGFTQATWDPWLARFNDAMKLRGGALESKLFVFFFCCCTCQRSQARSWSAALKRWQDDFNQQEGPKYGIFVKTQSNAVDVGNEGSRTIERWLTFARTPDEIAQLKAEPHLSGPKHTNCFCGTNESELCIHP
jgi:hypothetical protein